MASITELDTSREGGSLGVFGSIGHMTSWIVEIDDPEDEPIAVMAKIRGGPRIGSKYPGSRATGIWDPNGLVALWATRRSHETPFVWIVDVIYGTPLLFEFASTGWEVQISSSLETELVFHDLDGIPIGPFDYGLPIVGPLGETHVTSTNRGETFLFIAGEGRDRARKVEGAQRRKGIGRLTMTKLSPNFDENALATAIAATDKVNSERFSVKMQTGKGVRTIVIADAGKLIWEDSSVTPVQATVAGQSVLGLAWRVVISMGFRELGWQHNMTHWWEDDLGARSVVKRKGDSEPVRETFRIQDEANFGLITAMFELGT